VHPVSAVPLAGRLPSLVILVALGVTLAIIGWRGWQGRLAADGRLGVRTPRTLRSAETFRLANRVAGLPNMVGGAAAMVGGVAAFVMPDVLGTVLCTVIGLVGAVLIARAGGLAGDRAAAALPVPKPAGCGGCACGNCATAG
jgi:hypothetical protein